MEIKIGTPQILKILNILSWIIFIGLCVEAGMYLFNGIYTLTINSYNARFLNLLDIYNYNVSFYIQEICFISIVAILKAIMFYLIVKLLHEKKLNIKQPFTAETGRFISYLSYLAFGIGLFSLWAEKFNSWLITNNVKVPTLESLNLEGGGVWIFMAIVLFVIGQIFKRGIEIQSEIELTV
ncbi:DUF2975 domain-containing protein [Flavobacterium phragmitis]|uniref:DUF2975 domain-containing protein n=1 Tax=Flavobacterium phragmitis TaxID=739143 RepID=A0A1I1N4X1_9FLAO|nr:DUF2975 domain-containing protein [Flavobacterium phragmitis]SFC92475.1 Protein of unknown function [Flavobacterium phragmitis]